MRSNGFGGGSCVELRVRHVESGLSRAVPHSGCGVAGQNPALELDNRLDVRLPLGAAQLVGRVEDGGDARLIAVAASVMTFVVPKRRRGLRDGLDLLVQGRLVVLGLDDQVGIGLSSDLEMFF
jgi:hypothetical protein